jgi:S-adenosylmethionine:tRNA ribosyltransferase-isomerase
VKGTLTADYDFDLPEERIAQTPAQKRDESKLMVVNRGTGDIEHRLFRDIVSIVPSGDAIVVNTTKVFRARLLGTRDSGAPAEILLLKSLGADNYEAMVHPG